MTSAHLTLRKAYQVAHHHVFAGFPAQEKQRKTILKRSQEFCPHNVLFIFPNQEPLRISYLHHLCVMPVC